MSAYANCQYRKCLFLNNCKSLLRRAIGFLDYNCPKDGNLLIKSHRTFLGHDIVLCDRYKAIYKNLVKLIYKIGTKLLRVGRSFMQQRALLADSFKIVWNYTYRCNLKKHCYEDAGRKKPELSTDEVKNLTEAESQIEKRTTGGHNAI